MPNIFVLYNNCKIIPAPLIEFERTYDRNAAGAVTHKGWTITISGFCVPDRGSPSYDGSFYSGSGYPPSDPITLTTNQLFGALESKIAALTSLFSVDGHWLEVYSDTGTPIRMQPRWGKFVIPAQKMFNNFNWSITADCDFITPFDTASDPADLVPDETWEISRMDEVGRVHSLKHSISLSAKNKFDSIGGIAKYGWEVARDSVLTKLGFDATQGLAASVLDLTGANPYNYIRSQQVDKATGRFSASESFEMFNPSDLPTGLTGGVAIEEFTIENSYSNENGLNRVNLTGTIRGFEERDPTTYAFIRSRYDNAALRAADINFTWAKGLAQTVSGVTLNPQPISTTIARNKITGIITYSSVFDNRIGLYDSNNVSELVSIEFDNAASVIANIPIPFRVAGPVLQNTGTVTQSAITVNVEIVRPVTYGNAIVVPTFNTLATALSYIGFTPTQLYLVRDNQRWTEQTGRFSRSSTFIYQ